MRLEDVLCVSEKVCASHPRSAQGLADSKPCKRSASAGPTERNGSSGLGGDIRSAGFLASARRARVPLQGAWPQVPRHLLRQAPAWKQPALKFCDLAARGVLFGGAPSPELRKQPEPRGRRRTDHAVLERTRFRDAEFGAGHPPALEEAFLPPGAGVCGHRLCCHTAQFPVAKSRSARVREKAAQWVCGEGCCAVLRAETAQPSSPASHSAIVTSSLCWGFLVMNCTYILFIFIFINI